ncbi:MAG: c-type cytochrome [Pseudomonadota bacterium]|nr:c-type cytochrome [Pseudomonadota bacterium]
MRRVFVTLLAMAAAGLIFASTVIGLGLYNVSAKAGHLPGVSWLLHTTFRNSVRLRAPPEEATPDLSDPALIALGAGHYATACTPCHARPGGERTATMRAMVPEPPPIDEAVARWQPNHLHWIVQNGIKMSGMPGWPAVGREDEVWAVVAYLEAVRQRNAPGLRPTARPEHPAPAGAAYCRTCHGPIGRHVPRLDLQSAEYLKRALLAYRRGERPSGIMQQATTRVSPEILGELADYFSGRAPQGGHQPGAAPTELVDAGKILATDGTRDVPACVACHGPGARSPAITPRLAGQDRAFLETQLRLWRDGLRQGSEKMSAAARALSDDDIARLAAWYATLALQSETGE